MQILWRALLAAVMILTGLQAQAQGVGEPAVPADNGQIIYDLSGYARNSTPQVINASQYDTSYANGTNPQYGTCLGGNGTCINTTYRTSFTVPTVAANGDAITGLTTLTFAFRNDNGFFAFSDVYLGLTSTRGNLLGDPKFIDGSVAVSINSLVDLDATQCPTQTWCGFNQVAGDFSGAVVSNPDTAQPNGSGLSWVRNDGSNYFWLDGAVQQYDGIYQNVQLIPGQTYDVTFRLEEISANLSQYDSITQGFGDACDGTADYPTNAQGQPIYSNLATNGGANQCGNAANVAVYVGFPGVPQPLSLVAPEPASLAVFGTGLAGFGMLRRIRRRS